MASLLLQIYKDFRLSEPHYKAKCRCLDFIIHLQLVPKGGFEPPTKGL